MIYSFTSPQPKSIVSKLTKIWIFYTILSLAIVYGFGVYLGFGKITLSNKMNLTEENIDINDESANKIKGNLDRLNYEIELNKENKVYNDELANALLKLFALIPDQITINYINLEEKRLILKGITPSREIYSFLLKAPLMSAFTNSREDFYPLPNGWYNFTSISTLEEER